MGLFRRISSRFARKMQQHHDVYDPYISASSTDNPYLTEYGTGFVYHTLEAAMLATWMMVGRYDAYLADTLENIVLGMDSKMTDPDDPIQSAKGYVFELLRLARSSLAEDTDPYSLNILTSDEDTALTEDLSYAARAFLAAVLDASDVEAMRIAETYADDQIETYILFIVTTLTLVTREWYQQAFPEFADMEDGEEDVALHE
jgi:hypothetical protein